MGLRGLGHSGGPEALIENTSAGDEQNAGGTAPVRKVGERRAPGQNLSTLRHVTLSILRNRVALLAPCLLA
jgi:hypothetical protein